jgi:hypothetical protein
MPSQLPAGSQRYAQQLSNGNESEETGDHGNNTDDRSV